MDEFFEYDISKFNLSLGAVKAYFKNNYNVYFNKRTCAYDIWCNGGCIVSNMAYEEVQSYFEKIALNMKKLKYRGFGRYRSV